MGSNTPRGKYAVAEGADERDKRAFAAAILADLRALEEVIARGMIERGARRIGVEQELFLVDRSLRPARVAGEVLAEIDAPNFTTELARFQVELDLPPAPLGGTCLRDLEASLNERIGRVDAAAAKHGASALLAGILPTLTLSDLGLDSMTPLPRYHELNRVLKELHPDPFQITIEGIERLDATHDNVLLEACNSSFQIHLQVDVDTFAPLYNLAQAISAPVLAAAVNSPLLFGRRLWHETRIALFEQSTDARSVAGQARGQPSRVTFGDRWVAASVLEIYREQVARYPVVLAAAHDEDALALVARGQAPALSALCLHNGTVWRWNRACYGVAGGVPHLRIEHRPLPSGPTVLDEVANAALFYGLMTALPDAYGDVTQRMSFEHAARNFTAAARHGLGARFTWIDEREVDAPELLLDHLIPLARQGLAHVAVPTEDIDRYLGTIEERVRLRATGAAWALRSIEGMRALPAARGRAITRAMRAGQQRGEPVHTWQPAEADATDDLADYATVEAYMTIDLFTVRPDDVVDLATSVMDWEHVRHLPVEDADGRPVGVVSHASLLRLARAAAAEGGVLPVSAIMEREPVCIAPETPTLAALEQVARTPSGCLLVVRHDRLVGIVTERDLVGAARRLLAAAQGAGPDGEKHLDSGVFVRCRGLP